MHRPFGCVALRAKILAMIVSLGVRELCFSDDVTKHWNINNY